MNVNLFGAFTNRYSKYCGRRRNDRYDRTGILTVT
jgi:hypothetical protein